MKEKLVELKKVLRECLHFNYDEFSCDMSIDVDLTAENLIANGVTVQEWIPASEPPKDDLPVLVTCGRGYRPFVARYDRIWKRWKVSHTLRITHWQPLPGTSNLPQPPKGE